VRGFIDMVGTKLGFLPWGVCLLICGSVSDLMRGRIAAKDAENVTFWQRAMVMGTLSEDELGAVLLSADVVILPITQGGGSNLKTAEALVSGRPIVATTFAFRGYEEYLTFSGVQVADTPAAFRTAILEALEQRPRPRSAEEADMVRRLFWDHRLAPIVEALGGL
jgi:glycosyltransferase involved in cell wall biosynthesis